MYDNIEFVICCAGESSRNFPHSKGMTHKSLMPFGDKRLIDYILDDIVRIGGHHITIVCRTTGIIKLYKRALQTDEKIVKKLQEKERPDIAEVLKSTFLPNDIDLKFVLQKHPIGTGQLLVCARKAIQERHVVLIFPDDVIVSRPNEKPYIQYLLDDFLLNPKRIMLSGVNRKDVSNNAILINQRLIEKQKNATTHFAGMSPIILPNQLIKFMKKQYRTKKKWAKKTGKEWFYSHSSHRLILFTAPLSVIGRGCGRWNMRFSPFSKTAIREPSRSCTSAPGAINSDSISAHLMVPLTGQVKISDSVRRCFFCS